MAPHHPKAVLVVARLLGYTPKTIRDAIRSGRVVKSITWIRGKPKVIDTELLKQELESSRDINRISEADAEDLGLVPDDGLSRSDVTTKDKYWKAQMSELRFKEAAGQLGDVKAFERKFSDEIHALKTKILGLPSTFKQKHPELSLEYIASLEQALRDLLS